MLQKLGTNSCDLKIRFALKSLFEKDLQKGLDLAYPAYPSPAKDIRLDVILRTCQDAAPDFDLYTRGQKILRTRCMF